MFINDLNIYRCIIRQLVAALKHCICRGVLHRDVKLENVIFNRNTNETTLIDFGCGDYFRSGPYKGNNLKVNYCCMDNIETVKKIHNAKILRDEDPAGIKPNAHMGEYVYKLALYRKL